MDYHKPRGTEDILPRESVIWQRIEQAARDIFRLYDYREIRTPLFEDYNVFARNVGETSDIVTKEMYDFYDKGERHVTLRPEGTAGVVRAYVENKLFGPEYARPYKVYYMGPMFRYEKPQAGRQRQFHQIGAEALYCESPEVDVEMISMAVSLFAAVKVPHIKIVINSLGDSSSRAAYRQALIDYLTPHKDELSTDSQERLSKNPLRILDSKDEKDKEIVAHAPSILDYLDEYSAQYFEKVKKLLDELDIPYTVDPTMVRGLDYYTHTIFELMSNSDAFGGQWVTVCAGGRYDNLISELGGPKAGGIGFGMGVERLILLIQQENPELTVDSHLDLFLAAADEIGDKEAFLTEVALRAKGISCDKDYTGSGLKSQVRQAVRRGARYYAVLGESEVQGTPLVIHRVDTSEVQECTLEELKAHPRGYIQSSSRE